MANLYPVRHEMKSAKNRMSVCLAVVIAISAFEENCVADDGYASEEKSAAFIQRSRESYRVGDFEAAADLARQALEITPDSADQSGARMNALLVQAEAELALGKVRVALLSLDEAAGMTKINDTPALTAQISSSLGNAYLHAGRLPEAREYLENGIATAYAAGADAIAATALNNLGNLLAVSKLYDEAGKRYAECADLANKTGNTGLAAMAYVNATRIAQLQGDDRSAAAMLESVQKLTGTLPDSHDKAYVLLGVGRLRLRQEGDNKPPAPGNSLELAYQSFHAALDTAVAIGDGRAQSYALGYMGELYQRQARFEEAFALTGRAEFIAQEASWPELVYRWQWQKGRILASQGNLKDATDNYRLAMATLQPIRQDVLASEAASGNSFKESVGGIYTELADLILRQVPADGADHEQELLEARATVEMVKVAELEDYFRDDCVARHESRTAGVDRLAPNTAALYPIILPDRLELLLSLPDEMRRETVAISEPEITSLVHSFRKKLEKRTTHEYLLSAKRLYDVLIRPLEPHLRMATIKTVVIIPDGPLRTIPLSALHDGKEFLVQKYALATTPGLTLTDPHPIERSSTQVLINGLTEASQGFPALPYVAEELQGVSMQFAGTVLKDRQFRAVNLQQQLEGAPFSVVHIASHGQFKNDVRNTFLLTYDGKIDMDTLARFMGTSRYRDKPVELLTLSACQTAAGDDRAALGLAGVAIKAGARSALASLWFINDQASSDLVRGFYAQLHDPAISKAEALRQAQITLMSDKRYRHPSYWAPFLLIGNWL